MLLYKKNIGFTLAEVLITLGIIGVVAALTIPSLVKDYQDQIYLTQLKKAYSEINQALRLIAHDKGCPEDIRCAFPLGDSTEIGSVLMASLKLNKDCGLSGEDCFSSKINYYYNGKGETFDINSATYVYKFSTMGGYSIGVSGEGWSIDSSATGPLKSSFGTLYVDVNGTKPPNCSGKDYFVFTLTNGRGPLIYPYGMDDDGTLWDDETCTEVNTYGRACSARIIHDGWKIEYKDSDYAEPMGG